MARGRVLSDVEKVRLKACESLRARRFGDVVPGLGLWHALGLDEVFERLMRKAARNSMVEPRRVPETEQPLASQDS